MDPVNRSLHIEVHTEVNDLEDEPITSQLKIRTTELISKTGK